MSDSEVSEERRRWLQSASIGGLALLVAGCSKNGVAGEQAADASSDDEFCSIPGNPGQPSEKQLDDLADWLWSRFDQGTLVATKSGVMPMAAGVKSDREAFHRARAVDNWSKINRCRRLTGQCAFNAGVVAALIATAQGDTEIDKPAFLQAAEAVFEMQRNRARGNDASGDNTEFTGIAC